MGDIKLIENIVSIGLTTIYRFSLGSYINEFSFYMLISYILLDQKTIEIDLIPILKNKKIIKSILFLCGLLALSRAWMIGIILYYLIFKCFYHFLA